MNQECVLLTLMSVETFADIPGSIEVSVSTLDHHSLSISWKEESREVEDSTITGYIIKYKNHLDNWEEVKTSGRKSSFLLEHLRCGTKYQITVAPFNKAGRADPSPLVTAATAGSGTYQIILFYGIHTILSYDIIYYHTTYTITDFFVLIKHHM